MPLTCGNGHYVGAASSCARCGWTALGDYQPYPDNPFEAFEPGPSTSTPSDVDVDAHDINAPAIRAPFGAVRGVVVDGVAVPARAAGGVVPLRFLLLLAVVVTLVIKGPQVMAAIVEGTVRLTLLFIVPLAFIIIATAIIGRFLPVGGCLTAFLRIGMLGAVLRPRRHRPDPDGWDLEVLTPSGIVRARIAAALPLGGDEEIVIHGPTFNGTKHAWLVMVISPITCTRLGRGVVSAVVALIFGLSLCVLLLSGL